MTALLSGALAVLGTQHGKERVIGPVLEQRLGLRVEAAVALDTDRFGTFTRETPRAGSPWDAARAKAHAALALYEHAAVAVASEGSFGPHPPLSLVPCGVELVLLVDPRSGLALAGTDVTIDTNYASVAIRCREKRKTYAARR